jgi:cytochrome c peroxidase
MRIGKWLLLGSILFTVYLISCKKDPAITNYAPKPYNLELPPFFPQFPALKNNALTEEGVQLGRMLFYDPILSEDSTQSCASCHNQKRAFTDNGKAFSLGIKGIAGTRNSMPLFNLNWHARGFFWDGRAPTLQEQILIPIEDPIEMASTVEGALERINNSGKYENQFFKAFGVKKATETELAKAIEQFMLTLISSNAPYDKWRRGGQSLSQDALDGLAFTQAENDPSIGERGGDCFHCHSQSGELFSINDFTNNGLDAVLTDNGYVAATGRASDEGKFKAPSLRNLAFTAPYMHDGRFKTLEDVLDHYGDHVALNSPNIDPNMRHSRRLGQIQFTRDEKDKMLAFLNALNDSTFINNPAFSNPFRN